MSLTARLSAFALAGLAVVLAGFSAALYATASVYLERQIAARSDAALHALFAAVEVHSGDVQWEPLERKIALGVTEDLEQVRWTLRDEAGRLIDRSTNLDAGFSEVEGSPWSFTAWTALASRFDPEVVAARRFDGADRAALPADRTTTTTGFTLTVAVSHAPAAAMLRRIAAVLAGVSVAVWLTAAVAARFVCRRALRPVTAMAASANALGDDPARRVTVAETSDELEDLGRAFNCLLDRLHAAHDRQRRFTGDAAHQLRTPLAAVLGQLDVALRRDRSTGEYRRTLEVVRRRADGLRQVVESLLFLARAGAGDRIDVQAIDAADWLRGLRDDWASHERTADIAWDIPDKPCLVRAHAGLLGQALDNLIDNAAKYSDAGTPIRVALTADTGRVVLAVEDDGCGIAADDRPHLGEPFFRSAAARRRGTSGVGLGLAVVRRVADVFGGELRVESELGRCSRFALELPAACDNVQGDEPCPTETEAAASR